LSTEWLLEAPIERIWEALTVPADWPRWWRYVQAVVELEKGDAEGLGALRRYVWSSCLPYRLSFDMRTTRVNRPFLIEGVAAGDLNGNGLWELQDVGDGTTRVRYTWTVTTDKPWMNALAPILAPVFAWNHDQVMRGGGQGLARHLGAALLGFSGGRHTPRQTRPAE
jgi:uncharacterized protein YndB with AHSA1/START domain